MRPLTLVRNLRSRRRRLARMKIPVEALVLEVGSGQNPHPRADVLCDRYLLDDTERNAQAVVLDRPLVVGAIEALPFQDRAFDYVICAHVLEHLPDPALAASELARVARGGFLEVPSRENELLLPFPFHRWLIDREGDSLIFRTKPAPVPDPGLQRWFSRLSSVVPDFHDLFLRELEALGNVHEVVWSGELKVRVEGPPGEVRAESVAPPRELELRGLRELLLRTARPGPSRQLLDRLSGGADRRTDLPPLLSLLACPICRGALQQSSSEELHCGFCGAHYPILRGGGVELPYLVA